jgi:hypothetical protein
MSAHTFDCQAALVQALATAGIAGGRVYDDAPQDVAFPWVEIGDRQIIPDDTSSYGTGSDDGVSDYTDVHIWSRYRGKKEALQIVDAIHGVLHGRTLTILGRPSALAWVRTVRVITDPDGKTRHGIVSVEIIHRS